jgi:hypothetical protein
MIMNKLKLTLTPEQLDRLFAPETVLEAPTLTDEQCVLYLMDQLDEPERAEVQAIQASSPAAQAKLESFRTAMIAAEAIQTPPEAAKRPWEQWKTLLHGALPGRKAARSVLHFVLQVESAVQDDLNDVRETLQQALAQSAVSTITARSMGFATRGKRPAAGKAPQSTAVPAAESQVEIEREAISIDLSNPEETTALVTTLKRLLGEKQGMFYKIYATDGTATGDTPLITGGPIHISARDNVKEINAKLRQL